MAGVFCVELPDIFFWKLDNIMLCSRGSLMVWVRKISNASILAKMACKWVIKIFSPAPLKYSKRF